LISAIGSSSVSFDTSSAARLSLTSTDCLGRPSIPVVDRTDRYHSTFSIQGFVDKNVGNGFFHRLPVGQYLANRGFERIN
jgi:hypothetical protein